MKVFTIIWLEFALMFYAQDIFCADAENKGDNSSNTGSKSFHSNQKTGTIKKGKKRGKNWKEKKDEDEESKFRTVVKGKKNSVKDVTGDSSVIEGEKVRKGKGETFFESVGREDADIYVTSRGGGIHGVGSGASGGIHIRGLGGSPNTQILIVEDGVADYQGIFGHPIPDAYVPYLIDSVVIVKGGDSVLYGSNAMGGVISIKSKWRNIDGYELRSDSSFGSFWTMREGLTLLGKNKHLSYNGAISYLSSQGHRDGAGGKSFVGQSGIRYSFSPEVKITLKDKVIHIEGQDPGPASHPYYEHWFDVWRNMFSFALEGNGDKLSPSMIAYLNYGNHRLYDGFHSDDFIWGGKSEIKFALHKMVEILLGIDATGNYGNVENRITDEKEDIKGFCDFAFYNQITLVPFSKLRIVLGSRELINTMWGFVPLYKGGFLWNFYRGFYLRSRVSRNFREPTIRELYLPYPTANPSLKPEYSLNWDFGAGFDSNHLIFSVTGFMTYVENMIKYFGAWPSAEVVNIDKTTIWGVEGKAGFKDIGPVSFLFSINWQDVGRYTKQNPSLKLDASLEAGHSFSKVRIEGGISMEWVHGIYMENYSRKRIPDAFVMDANFRLRTKIRGMFSVEPYMIFRNILDRSYAYIEDYPMPGFSVFGGIVMEVM